MARRSFLIAMLVLVGGAGSAGAGDPHVDIVMRRLADLHDTLPAGEFVLLADQPAARCSGESRTT